MPLGASVGSAPPVSFMTTMWRTVSKVSIVGHSNGTIELSTKITSSSAWFAM